MHLVNEFCSAIGLLPDSNMEDVKYTTDSSEFTVVDGEESDYGIIKYFVDDVLVARKMVHGGDHEEIDFTFEGIELLKQSTLRLIAGRIGELKINAWE